ncbi:CPBP family intramembrane glutamic endopeptidase [Candidatus Mycolicibacterium alkanivorans]|uniref:CPBP family intramembrane metalloprotease n=1 Tax=Candidatus Mycolicibacterium alkanivorans TaxID=2954114 RepID=A0ABS9YYV7_9MYCO|nr:CPBP family intramembrane glutamic endopeptidase [Candidatus Mycolicibacterium alkanivorans]MCI4675964.1 CPBP family intramembrane metalloprotease [Candidatus Mycolicibacterium alkanivorans]
MRTFALVHPIATGLALVLAAGTFRVLDIFVFRLDERWGEIIVSKVIGVLIVLGFLWATGAGLAASGFRGSGIGPSVLLGAGLTVIALVAGYAVEFVQAAHAGQRPELLVRAIDPKTSLAGAAAFAVFLLIGNVVNSFAEEGLFRGLLIPLFLREVGPWPAVLGSALLFGLWHLPWAVKGMLDKSGDPVPLLLANFLPQALLGIVWGYLYLCTGNLWGSWVAHTLTNSVLNFLHVQTGDDVDGGLATRMITFTVVMLLGLIVIHWVSQRLGLLAVAPWGAEASSA